MTIVEGKTEQMFIESLLSPYLGEKNIFMYATQVSKPGQKGGDVKFSRVNNDIGLHLKQRQDTYVTTLIDYYGVKEWPGIDNIPPQATPAQIAQTVNGATKVKVDKIFEDQRADYRFIPYMAIHEFESLLFSNSAALADELGIEKIEVDSVLEQFGEPEAINNSPETAPSKRLDKWSPNGEFPKTTTGIAIAKKVGIPAMRDMCPLFNEWLTTFEKIQEGLE